MTIYLLLFANSKKNSYHQDVNKLYKMNRHLLSNFTGSLNESWKSDISVHKMNISILWLWGGGFRKRRRHHNKSQDQCSTLKNYLEVIIPKIVYPGKKPNDWSLDVEAKSRHWETLPSITAEWKQVKEDDYAISEQWNWWNLVSQVIVSHILSYCPWELQLLLAFPSLSFPGAHALLQPCMHWLAPLYA